MSIPKSTDLHRNFGFLVNEVARLNTLNFERHAAEMHLTLTRSRVLCYLQRNEGISQVRLAELTATDPMTLVRMLDRMEEGGLIERRPDPDDRRASRLFLKAGALPVLEEIWRVSDRARAETLAGLSIQEREQLLGLMQRVHANLDALVPETTDNGTAALKAKRKRAEVQEDKS